MSIPSNSNIDINILEDEEFEFIEESIKPVTVCKVYPIGYSALQRREADNLVDNVLGDITETHKFVKIMNVTRYPISGIEVIEEKWEPINV